MYDKCRMCGKPIQSAEDCKLLMSADKVETYCINCFQKKKAMH
ncbi:MAG: hypothetical protein ABIG95_01780 [Candidatus Woesearchaeota archaeon]